MEPCQPGTALQRVAKGHGEQLGAGHTRETPCSCGGGRGLGAAQGVPFGDAKPAQQMAPQRTWRLLAPWPETARPPTVHQHPSPSQPLGCALQCLISAPHTPDHTGNRRPEPGGPGVTQLVCIGWEQNPRTPGFMGRTGGSVLGIWNQTNTSSCCSFSTLVAWL